MFIYGKMATNAISVMSYLAQDSCIKAGSAEIATVRELSKPLTAKILNRLATAGLVKGQPGPGGGYSLARPASEITLYQIVLIFEQPEEMSACPFGPNWCGQGTPCPMHDSLVALRERNIQFLEETTLSIFQPPQAPTLEMLQIQD